MLRLTLVVLLMLVPVMIASAAVKPEDFAGIWLLDEGKSDLAEDSTGNGNDGQVAGAKWIDGKFGKALVFDDAGEVKIASTERLSLGDKFTMMAYFYANELNDWHQIIAKDAEYLMRIDPPAEGTNMSAFVWVAGGWEPRASAGVPVTETWTHFAATYDSKTTMLTVYVDGVKMKQSARAGKPSANNNPITFGHWGGGSYFIGIIDDVAILNTVLEEEDIKDIAEKGLKVVLEKGQSVQPAGKLAASWGDIKGH